MLTRQFSVALWETGNRREWDFLPQAFVLKGVLGCGFTSPWVSCQQVGTFSSCPFSEKG